jgi:hypothetical protein
MTTGEVRRVAQCRLRVVPGRWAWADERAADIAADFERQRARNPSYFNGPVQMLQALHFVGDRFEGCFVTADFASFQYWFARGCPQTGMRDCFGSAILRSAEGHLMLGVQRAGNLNAGRAYCPGGFIDAADVGADGVIDIDGSIVRELREETGLASSALARTPGYVLTLVGPAVSIGIEFRSPLPAEPLRAALLADLARQDEPELADILIARRAADVAGRPTTSYVPALLAALLPG